MASIKFRIKDTKANPTSIYAIMNFKGTRPEVKTGLVIDKANWSEDTNTVKRNKCDDIKRSLRKLEDFFTDEINKAQINQIPITKAWLKEIPSRCFQQPLDNGELSKEIYFTPSINDFIETSKDRRNKKGKKISIRTIQDYTTTLHKIETFEKYKNNKQPIQLININDDFRLKFVNFCMDELLHSGNTVGGHIDNIKLFCKYAEKKGYRVHPAHKDFEGMSSETHDFALTIDEVNAISEYDFSHSDRLDNTRDWFIVGLWTGLRISDILGLKSSDIDDGFIVNKNQKTGIVVVIPIHEQVKKILEKRGGEFPRKISDVKFNEYVKEVSKIVGLTEMTEGSKKMKVKLPIIDVKTKEPITEVIEEWRNVIGEYPKYELISSHICRRTFATYHYGKLPTYTLMNITGHRKESQFLEYVKKTPTEHAEMLKEMWKKLNDKA